jgi:hypothetical protein
MSTDPTNQTTLPPLYPADRARLLRALRDTEQDLAMVAAEEISRQQTRAEASCVIIAQLIAAMDKWSRDNLNSVRSAIKWLNTHAPDDLPLAATARAMMGATEEPDGT